MKSRSWRILWLAVGLALLGLVLWRSDPRKTWDQLLRAIEHPWLLAAAVGLLAAAQACFFLKWHLMSRLAGAAASARQSLRLFSTLFLVGTFTPGRAGELAVPLLMRGGPRLMSVTLVNRILESATTVAMGAVAFLFVFTSGQRVRDTVVLAAVLGCFVLAMVILSRRQWTERLFDALRRCLRPMERWRSVARLVAREDRIRAALGPFYEANRRLLQWPVVLLLGVMMVLIWLVMVAANGALIQATVDSSSGAPVTVPHLLAVMAVIAVSMFVSPTPGGLGVSEGAAVLFFRQLGYSQDFVPFLLLSRLGLYLVIGLFFVIGRMLGRPLPEPEAQAERVAGESP